MPTLVNIYTEAACSIHGEEMGEITLVACSVEGLLTLINNDKIDTENNYLVTEAQLDARGHVWEKPERSSHDLSDNALAIIGNAIMNSKNKFDK